ncbi:MAG: CpaD family pilus assembly lipoprotein [Hyphomicrobiaceae bacterium]
MQPPRTSASGRSALKVAAVLAAGALLASCSELLPMSAEEALVENTPHLGHPIGFAEHDEIIDVELPPAQSHLSRSQWVDVYRFALRYRNESTERLVVILPGRASASRWHPAVGDVRKALASAGVSGKQVAVRGGGRRHQISLKFERPVAIAPQCGHWQKDVARDRERVAYPDFGCATQRNFAGMVANPRDLIGSQAETPASSERRARVWSQYVKGDGANQSATTPSDTTSESKPKAAKK